MDSVCIYHNGNARIVEKYKSIFSHLTFLGNWAVSQQEHSAGCLYELSFADATTKHMLELKNKNVKVVRHISDYLDDQANRLPECEPLSKEDWIEFAVLANLNFADEIISEYHPISLSNPEHAVITTGRTASMHYRLLLREERINAFENDKRLDNRWINSESATLLWRKDSWECLTSQFIASQHGFGHNVDGVQNYYDERRLVELPDSFIDSFFNQCMTALNFSVYYKYILRKPIKVVFTEDIVKKESKSRKIEYNKSQLISNYDQQKKLFEQNTKKTIDFIFKNAHELLKK